MIAYPEFINRTWRSQEEVVQAPPIAYLVIPILEGPFSKILQNLKLGGVDDDDDRIIMEIVVCKCEECLEVIIRAHVPSGNRGIGDSRHCEVLRGIRNEQINPYMSFGNGGIATSTVCSNLIALKSLTLARAMTRQQMRSIPFNMNCRIKKAMTK